MPITIERHARYNVKHQCDPTGPDRLEGSTTDMGTIVDWAIVSGTTELDFYRFKVCPFCEEKLPQEAGA